MARRKKKNNKGKGKTDCAIMNAETKSVPKEQQHNDDIRTIEETKEETSLSHAPGVNRNDQHEEELQGAESIKKNKDFSWLFSGAIGGMVVILLLVFVAFVWPGFRVSAYYVNEDPSLMTELLSAKVSAEDSLALEKAIQDESIRRQDLLLDLVEQRVIVSSEDVVSNLSNYYNALIAVLAALLIILNLAGYFSWRSNANNALEQKQRELDDIIKNIDDSLEKNLEESFRRNHVLREQLESIIQEVIDQDEKLDEEEWEKLHLLLKKYKRKETLEAIQEDEQNNDGEIEG